MQPRTSDFCTKMQPRKFKFCTKMQPRTSDFCTKMQPHTPWFCTKKQVRGVLSRQKRVLIFRFFAAWRFYGFQFSQKRSKYIFTFPHAYDIIYNNKLLSNTRASAHRARARRHKRGTSRWKTRFLHSISALRAAERFLRHTRTANWRLKKCTDFQTTPLWFTARFIGTY